MNEISYGEPRPEAVQDLSRTMATQQMAGPASTEVLAQQFLARVQRDIDEQVDLRVQQQIDARIQQHLANWNPPSRNLKKDQKDMEFMLGSLGIAIPLTVVAGLFGGFPGMLVVWAGIIIINVAWSQSR